MSKFCTQCGTENLNEAKFCKSCGHSLVETELPPSHKQSVIQTEALPKQDEVANVSEIVPEAEHSNETPSSWSGWLLLIPIIVWVLYRLGVLADGNIVIMFWMMTSLNIVAEALGGAAAIIGIPLIVTTIIYLVKKAQDVQYSNFVKHTLIASILLLAVGVAANINTIRDEQEAAALETTSEAVDYEAAAVDAVAPVEAAPVLSKAERMEEACDGGDAMGCSNLGIMYREGTGVKQDSFKAVKLYTKACDGGNPLGCYNLGFMYYNGVGVKQDSFKAVESYTKACDGGFATSCYTLGLVYKTGIGVVKQDRFKEAEFFGKACDAGDADGCSFYKELQSRGY